MGETIFPGHAHVAIMIARHEQDFVRKQGGAIDRKKRIEEMLERRGSIAGMRQAHIKRITQQDQGHRRAVAGPCRDIAQPVSQCLQRLARNAGIRHAIFVDMGHQAVGGAEVEIGQAQVTQRSHGQDFPMQW